VVDAIRYASDETSLIGILLAGAIAVFLAGHVLVARRLRSRRPVGVFTAAADRPRRAAFAGQAAMVAAGAIGLTIYLVGAVQANVALGYGLNRTIAYRIALTTVAAVADVKRPDFDVTPYRADAAWNIPSRPAVDAAALTWSKPPHLVVFVLESARGEMIGKIIDGKPVAPNLTALANQGSHFRYAYSHAGFTAPSIKSIFTGKASNRIADDASLFFQLKRRGYRITAISGQDESFGGIDAVTGMRATADFFFDATQALEDRVHPSKVPGSLQLTETRLLAALAASLGDASPGEPRFFYFNVQAGHFPYRHPAMRPLVTDRPIARGEISASRKDDVALTYWNALANADKFVGDALALLRRHGFGDNALIAVIGDHGESLFDDGFLGHGHALNEIQTRVPLVLSRPGVRWQEPIGLTDVRDLLLRELAGGGKAAAAQAPEPGKAVLQYVGDIDHPNVIGIVEYGERRTVLDFGANKVFFSDLGRWHAPDEILADSELRPRVAKLVGLWDGMRSHERIAEVPDGQPRHP
jgi:hypothetical protein